MLVYIVGAGFAYPETVISNPFLAELSGEYPATFIEGMTGIQSRFSVLDPNYLRATKNIDIREGTKNSLCSPTDLAVKATEMALSRAGITSEAIGLILGDCATPRETIPSEAQRVAKRFTLRIPAYDLVSSSASISLVFKNLLSWKPERIPPYVLFVTTNTPTDRVDYSQGAPRLRYGDGAVAFILSTEHRGKLEVCDADFVTDPEKGSGITFDIFSHAKVEEDVGPQIAEAQGAMFNRVIQKHGLSVENLKWIGSPFDAVVSKRLSEEIRVTSDRAWSNVERCGDMLGSSVGCVLAERWDYLVPEDTIVLTQAGSGFSSGYALLRGVQ